MLSKAQKNLLHGLRSVIRLVPLLLFLIWPLTAGSDIFYTSQQIQDYCNEPPGSSRNNFCAGYIAGVADMLQDQPGTICLPPEIGVRELKNTFRQYTEARPDLHNFGAHNVVYFAIRQSFPCPPGQESTVDD
jgi:hypothetical protein